MPRQPNHLPCVDQGTDDRPCSGPPIESRRCTRHARTFQRMARRCDRPDCTSILDDPYRPLGQGRIRGRALPGPLGRNVTYCRRCEHLLLNPTPEVEAENIDRLFSQLRPAARGPGWIWTGRTNADGYGLMIPVGGVSGRHEWLPHRVMFGLFAPQPWHRITEVIDHRDHDRLNTAIFNLEPVSRAENRRRRDRPPRGPLQRMWSYPAALLAQAHGLPVPDKFPTLLDLFGVPEPFRIPDGDDAQAIVPFSGQPVQTGSLAA